MEDRRAPSARQGYFPADSYFIGKETTAMQIMSRKQSLGHLQNIDFHGDWSQNFTQAHAKPYQWHKFPGFSIRCVWKSVCWEGGRARGSRETVAAHTATCTAQCSMHNGNSRAALQLPYPHSQCSAQAVSHAGKTHFGGDIRLRHRDVLLVPWNNAASFCKMQSVKLFPSLCGTAVGRAACLFPANCHPLSSHTSPTSVHTATEETAERRGEGRISGLF